MQCWNCTGCWNSYCSFLALNVAALLMAYEAMQSSYYVFTLLLVCHCIRLLLDWICHAQMDWNKTRLYLVSKHIEASPACYYILFIFHELWYEVFILICSNGAQHAVLMMTWIALCLLHTVSSWHHWRYAHDNSLSLISFSYFFNLYPIGSQWYSIPTRGKLHEDSHGSRSILSCVLK
jgi:hypothetical protein